MAPHAESQSIKVAVRVRPLNSREKGLDDPVVVSVGGGGVVDVNLPDSEKHGHQFCFDYCYGMGADQGTVHEDLGQALLTNVMDGYNSCLFAYGQTGAGKSWSVTGDAKSPQHRGLLPRICEGLFATLGENTTLEEFRVVCTYLEIYNEKMRDLLVTSGASALEVRKHPTSGVFVPNLSECLVKSYHEIEKLTEKGNSNRMVSETAMNAQSSRSHAVFTLTVTQKVNAEKERKAQLHIVDLAGSERQKKTQAEGGRLKEGASINQSLTVLGQVIFALASERAKHVPFRNSKLTFLLSDSLSGNSRTVMIAAVSPAGSNFEETLNTLRFAQSVKKVKTQVTKNETVSHDPQAIIQQLRKEIAELKAFQSVSTSLGTPTSSGTKAKDEELARTRHELEEALVARRQMEELLATQGPAGSLPEEAEGYLNPLERQHQEYYLKQVRRTVSLFGRAEDLQLVGEVEQRFAHLCEHVEQANFIMSWLMEFNFAPKEENASWFATINWKVTHKVEGTLCATLLDRKEDRAWALKFQVSEAQFKTILQNLDLEYNKRLIELNSNPKELEPIAEDSDEAVEESCESPGSPERRDKRTNTVDHATMIHEALHSDVAAASQEATSSTASADAIPKASSSASLAGSGAESPGAEANELARLRAENERLAAELEALRRLAAEAQASTATAGARGKSPSASPRKDSDGAPRSSGLRTSAVAGAQGLGGVKYGSRLGVPGAAAGAGAAGDRRPSSGAGAVKRTTSKNAFSG